MLRNQVVMVKASEAEKNIAWEAEQAQKKLEMKALGATDPASAAAAVNAQAHGTGPCKLQVHGLDVNIGESDLKAVFEPLARRFISIQRDSTGRSRASALFSTSRLSTRCSPSPSSTAWSSWGSL